MLTKTDKTHFNILIKFLAKKDFESVTDIGEAQADIDLVVVMPGALLCIAGTLAEMYEKSLARNYIIAGGVGHSTHFIAENIQMSKKYGHLFVEGLSEADMYFEILKELSDEIKDNVYLENNSTNCGENSAFALNIAVRNNLPREKVLIMQDPTMQLRSHLTFKKQWESELFSYTPVIPFVEVNSDTFRYQNNDLEGLWSEERFTSLILGEMHRIEDNETGYGPRGKNYIVHIDLPEDVRNAYYLLKQKYPDVR